MGMNAVKMYENAFICCIVVRESVSLLFFVSENKLGLERSGRTIAPTYARFSGSSRLVSFTYVQHTPAAVLDKAVKSMYSINIINPTWSASSTRGSCSLDQD